MRKVFKTGSPLVDDFFDEVFNDVYRISIKDHTPSYHKLSNGFPFTNIYEEVYCLDNCLRTDIGKRVIDRSPESLGKRLIFEFSLAGYSEEELNISIDQGNLILTGEVNKAEDDTKEDCIKFIHKGITTRDFNVMYSIPDKYNLDTIQASFKDGILKISFQENPEKKPKKIKIN